ncbi:NLR family CARD domain-containing protein 3-like [Lingula anatina]|uniref:NLR family CARD domain-containing protein 3-like n=1 Tax=Lingula anatina TaxID=7574 RepID=A0A1S3JI05_LINAN|nr:NLR family CARD domain-containing protein 3-like [Lingula anatina]XP_013410022.1 NLR family CARD domain-containing protein 3-like [Lingula anatina]|eukprot:XP_013410021.1 NLR family CARD domain-containing protein 3-like [Lingula anatina]
MATENDVTQTQISSEEEMSKVNLSNLSRLLVEGGTLSMKELFDSIHPPITLHEHLAKGEVHKTLRGLKSRGLISEAQWGKLYPRRKKNANSENYGPTLLYILLRHICHLAPPYPNGWDSCPLQSDKGISADVARVQWYRRQLVSLDSLPEKDFNGYWSHITEVLLRMGGPICNVRIKRMQREAMDGEMQQHYRNVLKSWHQASSNVEAIEREIQQSRNKPLSLASPRQRLPAVNSKEKGGKRGKKKATLFNDPDSSGMSQEERNILLKFYKTLVDNIQADDVLARLVEDRVLTTVDKENINTQKRNTEKMRELLDILPRRASHAYMAFCDAIRFKYPEIHEQMSQARAAMYREAITNNFDVLEYCRGVLSNVYKSQYSRWRPATWHESVQVDLHEFTVPLELTDSQGRVLPNNEIFDPHPKCEAPGRVLLSGLSGYGKSTALKHMAYSWAKNHGYFPKNFQLLFLVDLRMMSENQSLQDAIFDQLIPFNFKLTKDELWSLIVANQKDTLFLLDSYDHVTSSNRVFSDLIGQKLLDKVHIVMTTEPSYVQSLMKYCDTALHIMGITKVEAKEDLVRQYAQSTKVSVESYAGLMSKLASENEIALCALTQSPFNLLSLCGTVEAKVSLQFGTQTFIMDQLMLSLQRLFCTRQGVDVPGGILPEEIKRTISQLEEIAFQSMLSKKTVFKCDELNKTYINALIYKLGPMVKFQSKRPRSTEYCMFANKAFQEYLAARYLADMTQERFFVYSQQLVKDKSLHNVCVFYCGLKRHSYEVSTVKILHDLFSLMAKHNLTKWRAITFSVNGKSLGKRQNSLLNKSTRRAFTHVDLKTQAASDYRKTDVKNGADDSLKDKKLEGRVLDFILSLECVNECQGRKDSTDLIAKSIPARLLLRQREPISAAAINGLASVVRSPDCQVTEMDIKVNHFCTYNRETLLTLAEAVRDSANISILKLISLDTGTSTYFLATALRGNTSIKTVKCIEESQSENDKISASVWANLQTACQNMTHVTSLTFVNMTNAPLLSNIIRHTPLSIQELHFPCCSLNLVSAEEMSVKLEHTKQLQVLNLCGTKLESMNMLSMAQGLKVNQSLKELLLTDTQLDNNGIQALSEALKFNHTVQRLDLSRINISNQGCRTLAAALAVNVSVQEVLLMGTKISREGMRIVKEIKKENLNIVGLDSIYRPAPVHMTANTEVLL